MSQTHASVAWSVLPLLMLAGGTDALMILHSKELLGVYMTGNTTKLGDYLMHAAWAKVAEIASVLATFVLATTLAAWAGEHVGRWRSTLLLTGSGLLLMAAGMLASQGADPYPLPVVLCIAAAMGTLNQVRADEPGVTFVTGTLVKFGRSVAAGKPVAAADSILRWLCFLAGALGGTALDTRIGTATFYLLGTLALLGAISSWALRPAHRPATA